MSSDSIRKQSKQGNHGQVVLPQPINDLSLIESVAGFIHEVVPQAYSSVLPGDSRDGILWARFDTTDFNDPDNYPQFSECESDSTPPVLLVLGYATGVQVWSVGGSGEATELLSWCQGVVRALRFLLRPESRDPHSAKRPLVAIVDSSSPGPQFSTLSFISLKTAEVVKMIKFNSPICEVHCNRKSVVVTFSERIAVFDSATLEDRLTITTCYPSPGNSLNPIALGTRWLAYGEKRLTTWQRSSGGCEGDGAQSYTSAVIHAAKSLGKGLRELGGSLTGTSPQSLHNTQAQPGIVSIIDIERKGSTSEEDRGNMIAHFVAHTSAVVAMAFDPSGLLLITADRHGHRFNVFRIHPHPCTSQLTAVHHLYVLHRGETTARVQDIAISWDSRWVAVSSVRGTTHVFPITPYGGLVTVRTHTTPHVVNKLSRFERSAGLRDGRGSPLLCEAPTTPPPPRLPPYPHPTVITPLAQLRARPDDAPLAAAFAPPRAWIPGRPKSKRTCADSLYIIYSSGALMQYDLDPKIIQGVAKEKISFDTPIELGIEAKAEWILPKPPYTSSLCPPLPPGHLLLDLPSTSQPPPDKWLSQVEIVTHTGPHRRLWMGPQFTFKSIDPLPASSGEGDGGSEGGNPLRSNPVNMPHRPFLLVEIGSGSPQMAEVDEAGGRLREDLADAMLETQNSSGQAKGKLRRAEIEWQVNPLGAVQTQPAALHSHWPHPIFFEPYSPEHYRGIEQLPTQKNIDAALERLKQQDQSLQKQELPVESVVLPEEKSAEPEIILENLDENLESLSMFLDIPSSASTALATTIGEVVYENVELLEGEHSSVIMIPSTLQSEEVKSVSLDDSHEGISKCKELSPKEKLKLEDPSSSKQETNEKTPKPPGKKNKKKRNGNDKKTKKEQLKQPIEECNPPSVTESQITPEIKNASTEELKKPVSIVEKKVDTCLIVETASTSEIEYPLLTCEVTLDKSVTQEDNKFVEPVDLKEVEATAEIYEKKELHTVNKEEPSVNIPGSNEVEDCSHTETAISTTPEYIEKHDISPEVKCILKKEEENVDCSLGSPCENSDVELLPIQRSEELEERDLNGNNRYIEPVQETSIITLSENISETFIEEIPSTVHVENTGDAVIIFPSTESDLPPESTSGRDLKNDEVLSEIHILQNFIISTSDGLPEIESPSQENVPLVAEEHHLDDIPESTSVSLAVESHAPENSPQQGESSPSEQENTVASTTELETDEFVTVPSKISRRRRKKEKKLVESIQAEITEVEPLKCSKEKEGSEEMGLLSKDVSADLEKAEITTVVVSFLDEPIEDFDSSKLTESCKAKEEGTPLEPLSNTTISECANLPQTSVSCVESVASVTGAILSDQVPLTDRSEIEDVSSHSGKESDDPKIIKKERSRRQKRSESSDKDRSELKKKSCSPSSTKPETKDSESSDETGKNSENKLCASKVPKRKKGKKSEELVAELPSKENLLLSREIERGTRTVKYEEKSLNSSSVESSSDSKGGKGIVTRSWSHSTSSSDQQQNGIDDRDSVYESCNDDGASDSLAFESSKEDFDEISSKILATEPSSSNTEERTDTSDKTNQPLKKVRKQKKKKR